MAGNMALQDTSQAIGRINRRWSDMIESIINGS